MTQLTLDSGGAIRLAHQNQAAAALIITLRLHGLWPPVVPSVVLVECLSGRPTTDVVVNRFLKTCEIVESITVPIARRAGVLRGLVQRGSAVAAIVVAMAEPGGAVVTGDLDDLRALASHADDVIVHRA